MTTLDLDLLRESAQAIAAQNARYMVLGTDVVLDVVRRIDAAEAALAQVADLTDDPHAALAARDDLLAIAATGLTFNDLGPALTCSEAEALSALLALLKIDTSALLASHHADDLDDGDEHAPITWRELHDT